jgi:7,8-dihydropterin-6-yl-methyl-4-(beta-D-ribofuranosyl)aminobenzene 5'-phosphate synthase
LLPIGDASGRLYQSFIFQNGEILMAARVRITCLVDNSVLEGTNCWGEDGVSILVETSATRILFDTGSDPQVLAHNAAALNVEMGRVRHVVLSHGHRNHTGALDWVLTQSREPMVVADPDVFLKKMRKVDKDMKQMGITLSKEQLTGRAALQLTDAPYPIAPGIVCSGRIPRVTPFEIPLETNYVEQGGLIDVDSYIDDRSLILNLDKGLVIVTGCAHAGLINTLAYAKKTFNKDIAAVIGGTHMSEYSMDRVQKTLEALRMKYKVPEMYLNHCTGMDAYFALRGAIGNAVKTFPAGTTVEF